MSWTEECHLIRRLFILFYQYDIVVDLLQGFMEKGDKKSNFSK